MKVKSPQKVITRSHIANGMDYGAYLSLSAQLFSEGKTTGPKQSEALTRYTGLNLHRMKRLHKTTKLSEESLEAVQAIDNKQVWLVLTEAWCGDAAQIVPIIKELADQNPLIQLVFLLRDENLDIMDAHLTNGGRSIPKLIVMDEETLDELGTWGPRPTDAQAMYMDFKEKAEESYDTFQVKLQGWYNRNRGKDIQEELSAFLRSL